MTRKERKVRMLTKKDKQIVAGFITVAIIGFGGSMFFLLNSGKDEPEKEVEQTEVVEGELDSQDESPKWKHDVNGKATFEDENKRELKEEDLENHLIDARGLVMELDFEGVLSLLEPVMNKYDLSGEKGQELADIYTDANLIVTQLELTEARERADLIKGLTDPTIVAYTLPHLPLDVFLHSVMDGNSAALAGKGEVSIEGDLKYHTLMVPVEGEEYKEINPELLNIPQIKLYLEMSHEYYDLIGFYSLPLRVQGVDVMTYIAKFDNDSLLSLGYYVDNELEFGDRFQSVDFHLSHRQRLEESVYSNWDVEIESEQENMEEEGE